MEPQERISAKLSKFRSSFTLGLKHLAAERTAKGLPVYDFGLGETKGHLDLHIREAGEIAFRNEETISGSAFMQDGYLRISFATPDEHIIEGIRSVRRAFESLL